MKSDTPGVFIDGNLKQYYPSLPLNNPPIKALFPGRGGIVGVPSDSHDVSCSREVLCAIAQAAVRRE